MVLFSLLVSNLIKTAHYGMHIFHLSVLQFVLRLPLFHILKILGPLYFYSHDVASLQPSTPTVRSNFTGSSSSYPRLYTNRPRISDFWHFHSVIGNHASVDSHFLGIFLENKSCNIFDYLRRISFSDLVCVRKLYFWMVFYSNSWVVCLWFSPNFFYSSHNSSADLLLSRTLFLSLSGPTWSLRFQQQSYISFYFSDIFCSGVCGVWNECFVQLNDCSKDFTG